MAQSWEQVLFTFGIVGSILPTNYVRRVSQRSAESRGFSPGAPFSSTGKVDMVGLECNYNCCKNK